MSSSDIVNYSIRQNKAIERGIVFDGLRLMKSSMALTDCTYLGFGSVWFTDFHLAHRYLSIDRMISIESDDVVFKRAQFNRPYRTVDIHHGLSCDVIPRILQESDVADNPIIAWLDFDQAMDIDKLNELEELSITLPDNSFLITTFSANSTKHYGKPVQRLRRMQALFGDAAPDVASNDPVFSDVKTFAKLLGRMTLDTITSKTLRSARPGGAFISAFDLTYRDGTQMVTVGGFLPSPLTAQNARSMVSAPNWIGKVADSIVTAPLTIREVMALQSALPQNRTITRADVQNMGFDLREDQLESFIEHYLRYPTFAQLAV